MEDFIVKQASAADSAALAQCRQIMTQIRDENPVWWPNGLSPEHFDSGSYLVIKKASAEPVGFVGWQNREKEGRMVGYYSVGILAEHRGCGFAKKAVAQLLEEKAASCDQVRALIVPGNTASEHLASALGVSIEPILVKSAGWGATLARHPYLTNAGVGLLGSGAWDAGTHSDNYTESTGLGTRIINGMLNAALFGSGLHNMRSGNKGFGLQLALSAPGKDMMVQGNILAPRMQKTLEEIASRSGNAATAAAAAPSSFLGDIGSAVEAHPWISGGLAALGAGTVGMNALSNYRMANAAEEKSRGRVQVNLPSKSPSGQTTSLDLPMEQFDLSKNLYHKLERDTRRHLRADAILNTKHRTPEAEPPQQ